MIRTVMLFQEDSYLKEFTATVEEVRDNGVVLDMTAFHPTPYGGLDTDTGILRPVRGGDEARVLEARVDDDVVVHIVDRSGVFHVGDEVHGVIDWDRRYRMMKLHTASHILASILYERHGAMVTGGHITAEYARDDFSIESSDWKKLIEKAVEETNKVITRCIEVKIYWIPREEALKIPGLVKLADKMPPEVEKIRVVEIPGVDLQADGGPHVRNTCEIGKIRITKFESKGRRRRRVYYTLE